MTEQKHQTTSAIADELETFLRSFKDRHSNYKYFERINNMMASNTTSIVVDYIDLDTNKPELTRQITDAPDEMLEAFNGAVYSILREIHYDYAIEIKDKLRVRIGNYSVQKGLREITADAINTLITVPGMVVRTSEIKPLAKRIAYVCQNCDTLVEAYLKGLTQKKPTKCTNCNGKELEMDAEKSYFADFQLVRIQELPEDLPAGQLPHYVEVTVMDDLVDRCRPGDRVLLTGIVRIEQEPSLQIRTSLFRLRMEGNNIEYLSGIFGNKDERTVDSKDEKTLDRIFISNEDKKRILAIANMPDAYDKLIASFAPHIYGHEIIKESILLLIVGSVTKKLADGSSRRGDINIFLVGDPGTAKSEMLKFAAKIAPRGLYTSGRGTTAAGLTAAVIRDKSGILMLEAGAVVLGDQGLVCIDEFDKIKSEDRSALHEVMEQQTCSVAKGGIVATLNARTSILSAANPKYGKYDPFRNITENVDPLPIPLLTRFDIIHVIRDNADSEKDNRIASHILEIHRDIEHAAQSAIEIDLFRKYLAYAKEKEPNLTTEAIDILRDYYLQMRNVDSEGMITATPRQLEGLVRLATARARLLMKDSVDREDAERAKYLLSQMLQTVGIDVNTGKVDFGVLHGKPLSETSKLKTFTDVFNGLSGEDKNDVEEKNFINELVKSGKFTEDEAKEFIRKAMQNGQIYERKAGFYAKA
jgi:replicative DNA helicase Mcm